MDMGTNDCPFTTEFHHQIDQISLSFLWYKTWTYGMIRLYYGDSSRSPLCVLLPLFAFSCDLM